MTKVLVTGGCGFIGSNLVDILVEDEKNNVWVVDDLSSSSKEHCNKKATYVFADIKKVLNIENNLSFLQDIDIIYHLAADSRIQPSFESPQHAIENNAYGTATVCDYARRIGAKVVYAGSSSYYGGVYLNPYAFSKWQGEEVCKMYSEVYGVPISIARFFNVYGPRNPLIGQYTPVVAIFEQQCLQGGPLTIVGDGEQRRDFTHVEDICHGLIAISKEDYKAEIFNLGTGKNYSINDLVSMFNMQDNKLHLDARPGEARATLADISKTVSLSGWKPKHKLESYVKKWLKKNLGE